VVRSELGCDSDNDTRTETISRFADAIRAIFASLAPPAAEAVTDVAKSLADFEVCYAVHTRATTHFSCEVMHTARLAKIDTAFQPSGANAEARLGPAPSTRRSECPAPVRPSPHDRIDDRRTA
jgi:hypothetical protein